MSGILGRLYVERHFPAKAQARVQAIAVGNRQRLADWNYAQALARLGQPVDVTEWWIAPQSAVAALSFQQNAYNFSAALLQAPKFDPTASDAANYGAIGAIIGHEVSHFVDTLGAAFDAYRHTLGSKASNKKYVRQLDRQSPGMPATALSEESPDRRASICQYKYTAPAKGASWLA